LPSEDRWPPAAPRGDDRAWSAASDPRWGADSGYSQPRQPGTTYGRPRSPDGYAPPRPRRTDQERAAPRKGPVRPHGKKKRRVPAFGIFVLVIGLVAVVLGLRFAPGSPFAPSSAPDGGSSSAAGPTTPPPPPPLPFRAADITPDAVGTTGFLSWALMDMRSGEIVGSDNMKATTTTMSMIKAWVAADYLRQHPTPTAARQTDLEKMIRNSDNSAAERIYNLDGTRASITRAVQMCGLTETAPAPSGKGFGYTVVSAEDAVRIAACIANGTAAGEGTNTLLGYMRSIVEPGNRGPANVLPASVKPTVAYKNGWDEWTEDKTFRTNCMAFGDTWSIAIMLQYPRHGTYEEDMSHNFTVCEAVATKLLNPLYKPATP
jgi:hypothetical protein